MMIMVMIIVMIVMMMIIIITIIIMAVMIMIVMMMMNRSVLQMDELFLASFVPLAVQRYKDSLAIEDRQGGPREPRVDWYPPTGEM